MLLFIDVDNFKTVNDEDGHAEGDRVLRRIGESLRNLVRVDDAICRLGGDEFLVFLPAPVESHRVDNLEASIIDSVRAIDDRISCSIGHARRTPDNMLDIEMLLKLSDLAMYENKRNKAAARR